MKQPIGWHEGNLCSMKCSLARYEAERDRVQKQIDRISNGIDFLTMQIEEAKRAKKDGFDAGRYKHKIPQ